MNFLQLGMSESDQKKKKLVSLNNIWLGETEEQTKGLKKE
jgi:hypothetical protein